MKPRVIAVDVDGVIADLDTEWLRRYNTESGDDLTPDQLTGWNIENQIWRGWKERFYEILHNPWLYESVNPYAGAREAVDSLRALGQVVFVTSTPVEHLDGKYRWLLRHGFLTSVEDYMPTKRKHLINAHVLLDDHVKNVEAFPNVGMLVTRPHNAKLQTNAWRIPGTGLDAAPEEVAKYFKTLDSLGV